VSWRPLWFYIFALSSVVAGIFLLLSFFDWLMAGFDCGNGYFACRQTWFRNEGVWSAVIAVVWTAAAIWLYRTREKK
jgi:hypothetical protein